MPEFIIDYEWPLAHDFVEGVEPENQPNYKPMSIARVPSADNQPNSAKPFTSTHLKEDYRDLPQFGQPFQQRDRSPAHRT